MPHCSTGLEANFPRFELIHDRVSGTGVGVGKRENTDDLHILQFRPGPWSRVDIERNEDRRFGAHALFP